MIPYNTSKALTGLLNAIKDNTGVSNQDNIDQILLLIKNSNSTLLSDTNLSWINKIKNKNGVIDSKKIDYIISRINEFSYSEQVNQYVSGICIIDAEVADSFYDKLKLAFGENARSYTPLSAFEAAIKFCFNKDGTFKQEELDKISDVGKYLNGTLVDEKILRFIELKENRDLIKELHNKGCNFSSDDTSLLAEATETYSDENGSISPFLKNKLLEFTDENLNLKRFFINFNACMPKNGCEADFDNKMFKCLNAFYTASMKGCSNYIGSSDNYLLVLMGQKDFSELSFNEKLNMISTLDNVCNKNKDDSDFDNFRILADDFQREMNLKSTMLPVAKEDKEPFMTSVLGYKGVQKGELSDFEKVMADSILKFKKMNRGLPLLYSRKNFIKDLNKLCDTKEKQEIFKNRAKVELFINMYGEIDHYDGLIELENFDKENEFENSLYKICHKFFYENQIQTGDEKLDSELNKIIKAAPEFINVIGKRQHATQKYSLDIHELLVLANSINNPDYKKLRNLDKIMLKAACIFHDISKKEGVIDKTHQYSSSLCAKEIGRKFFSNPESLERFYELIYNHHWLESYNTSCDKTDALMKTAFMFRRPYDFEIAKIMARADLLGVSDDFYEYYKYALNDASMKLIEEKLEEFYSTGCAILSDYPDINKISEKHKETLNGIQYKVINFHKIKEDEDLSEYGFNKGKTKKDIRLLIHMVDDNYSKNDFNNLALLLKSNKYGVLSESLIDLETKKTFFDRNYGVILAQPNINIINTSRYNQSSCGKKDFSSVIKYLFRNNLARIEYLTRVLSYLGIDYHLISKNEIAEFYKNNLADKTSISQFVDSKEYVSGGKKFTGKDLKNAVTKYQNRLVEETGGVNNEIIGYEPMIKAVVAKKNKLSDAPVELLEFAHKNNLPVVLI